MKKARRRAHRRNWGSVVVLAVSGKASHRVTSAGLLAEGLLDGFLLGELEETMIVCSDTIGEDVV
jgi:hypothetical protein